VAEIQANEGLSRNCPRNKTGGDLVFDSAGGIDDEGRVGNWSSSDKIQEFAFGGRALKPPLDRSGGERKEGGH